MTKQQRRNLVLIGMGGVGFISGFLAGAFDPLPPLVIVAGLTIGLALAFWGSVYWWKLADEAQREAHKSALYWGGSHGLVAGLLVLIVVSRLNPELITNIHPGAPPQHLLELGYAWAAISVTIGYGVAWAIWWLKRR